MVRGKMKSLIFVLLTVTLGAAFAGRFISTDEIDVLFKKAFNDQLSEDEAAQLRDVLDIVRRPEHVSLKSVDYNTEFRTNLDCIVCRSAFAALFDSVKNGQTDTQLGSTIAFFCYTLGIENEKVCKGVTKLNMPILAHIIRTTPEATPAAFCGLVLQSGNDRNACPIGDSRFEWSVELPGPSPGTENVPDTSSADNLNVVLITDTHLDPLYEAGGVADCDEPTCCRKGQKPARASRLIPNPVDEDIVKESLVEHDAKIMLDLNYAPLVRQMRGFTRNKYGPRNNAPAGYWGDYRNCDTPLWAYDETIDTITETHKNIDLVYYIGDTIDHGVWETSYELISDMNVYLVDKLRRSFGDDVVILPVIGNHEAQPTNQFAPSYVTGELNTTWLYEAMAKKWNYYLTEEALATFKQRGDYSMLVKPGLRVITINNNVAYRNNWWLVFDPLDAKRHLDFLVEELYKAELAGEKVHILTHIPPGVADLIYTWTREYNRIVNRFTKTIAAEFNGHTHSDEFKIFYNDKGEAINVAWGVGGVTAYNNYNLNYKFATFDAATYAPRSIMNYVYNLTEANLTPNRRPHWFQLYNMTNAFQIEDLSANSMDMLVNTMVTRNKLLLDFYSAYFSKLSDARWPWCNTDCKLNNLCKAVVTVLWDRRKCDELVDLYYSTRQINNQLTANHL